MRPSWRAPSSRRTPPGSGRGRRASARSATTANGSPSRTRLPRLHTTTGEDVRRTGRLQPPPRRAASPSPTAEEQVARSASARTASPPAAGSRDRTHWPATTVTAPTASRAPDHPSGTPCRAQGERQPAEHHQVDDREGGARGQHRQQAAVAPRVRRRARAVTRAGVRPGGRTARSPRRPGRSRRPPRTASAGRRPASRAASRPATTPAAAIAAPSAEYAATRAPGSVTVGEQRLAGRLVDLEAEPEQHRRDRRRGEARRHRQAQLGDGAAGQARPRSWSVRPIASDSRPPSSRLGIVASPKPAATSPADAQGRAVRRDQERPAGSPS